MNPQGMYIPGMGYGMQQMPYMGAMGTMGRGIGSMRGAAKGAGLIKSFNWGGLLNNASRTLGVVNQAIPLVKQAGPMVNNMKSMLKLASVFKDETDATIKKNTTTNNTSNSNNRNYNNTTKSNNSNNYSQDNSPSTNNYNVGNTPNFFL